jgi:uncharacterized protein
MKIENQAIDLLEIYKKQLLNIIEKNIPGCKVILFGSRATGTQKEGSDIDICLDAGFPVPFDSILDMYVDLDETTIPVKVDLVDLYTVDEKIRQEITKKGIVWKA